MNSSISQTFWRSFYYEAQNPLRRASKKLNYTNELKWN